MPGRRQMGLWMERLWVRNSINVTEMNPKIWCFLWRKMQGYLVNTWFRSLISDLIWIFLGKVFDIRRMTDVASAPSIGEITPVNPPFMYPVTPFPKFYMCCGKKCKFSPEIGDLRGRAWVKNVLACMLHTVNSIKWVTVWCFPGKKQIEKCPPGKKAKYQWCATWVRLSAIHCRKIDNLRIGICRRNSWAPPSESSSQRLSTKTWTHTPIVTPSSPSTSSSSRPPACFPDIPKCLACRPVSVFSSLPTPPFFPAGVSWERLGTFRGFFSPSE